MKRKQIFMLLGDAGILIGAVFAPFAARLMLHFLPDCAFARMGILCPSCGATRCVLYFFTGQPGMAFAMNPFAFGIICYVIVWLIFMNLHCFARWDFPGRAAKFMLKPATVITLAVAYAIFGVLRNFL